MNQLGLINPKYTLYWCSLVEAKGPLISMEFFSSCCFVVSNHNFACTKEHHRLAQLGLYFSHKEPIDDKRIIYSFRSMYEAIDQIFIKIDNKLDVLRGCWYSTIVPSSLNPVQ